MINKVNNAKRPFLLKKSFVAQALFNLILYSHRGKGSNLFWKINARILRFLATILVSLLRDPVVSYRLEESRLLLPLSHNLPIIKKCHPYYSTNVGRIASILKGKYPDLSLIDIGANIGDTVAILRSKSTFPILCIDGDKCFFSILSENARAWPDVHLVNSFVGDSTGNFSGRLEILGGTGRLVEDHNSSQNLEMRKLSDIVRANPGFAKAKMIKVDTDGFDCKILKSELALLAELKPVIFFEYDPYFFEKSEDDGYQIFHDLKNIGYNAALVFENTGEYLLHVHLNNDLLLEDIHHFYSGWAGSRYCDICVFHEVDLDVFRQARSKEIEFFDAHCI